MLISLLMGTSASTYMPQAKLMQAQGKQRHSEPPPPDEINGTTDDQPDNDTDEERKSRTSATSDESAPYFHFHQFRDEPQTLASELAAMLLEFQLDEQQTTSLLDLLREQINVQRKALAVSESL
jgi:hypothetical protein